jgi:hypothetical protein
MAIKQISPYVKGSCRNYEFIIDNDNDVPDLPKACAPGSTALSCASGKVFMLNASGNWVEFGGGE